MYEWDETKRAKNLANHGLDFALIEAFDWEQAIIEKDERRDLRKSETGRLVTSVTACMPPPFLRSA
jgi:uncharacterized DUF497 family protein